MTLRPKFYAKLVSAITRRRMNENQRFLGESSQMFTQILNPLSKQKFKHFSKIDLLGFAAIAFYNTLYIYNQLMSKHVIYDIGTEILYKTCFGHNSTQNERTSMIFGRIFTEFYVDSEFAIKTIFEALLKNALNLALIAYSKYT